MFHEVSCKQDNEFVYQAKSEYHSKQHGGFCLGFLYIALELC